MPSLNSSGFLRRITDKRQVRGNWPKRDKLPSFRPSVSIDNDIVLSLEDVVAELPKAIQLAGQHQNMGPESKSWRYVKDSINALLANQRALADPNHLIVLVTHILEPFDKIIGNSTYTDVKNKSFRDLNQYKKAWNVFAGLSRVLVYPRALRLIVTLTYPSARNNAQIRGALSSIEMTILFLLSPCATFWPGLRSTSSVIWEMRLKGNKAPHSTGSRELRHHLKPSRLLDPTDCCRQIMQLEYLWALI